VPVIIDEAHAAGRRFGAIVVGKGIREEEEEMASRAVAGTPYVLVNRLVETAEASWVSVDFREAAGDAVRRLAAAGCRRIACRAAPENRRVDIHKEEGFRRAADQEGIEPLVFPFTEEDLQKTAREALSRPDRPDGWFTLNDEDAMRVIRVASTLGLKVPGDLSVIGVNDVAGAAFFSPAITSVSVPFRACGEAAVDAVLHLLDNPLQRSIKVLMRHSLAERESCAPAQTTLSRSTL
jgi:LacI family transcriptional regulator